MDFCEKVRQETNVYWEASFAHPFVRGIADGTLPLVKFKMYMLQDAYYLKHYTKVLALAAAKADFDEDIQYFLTTAQFIHEAELALHRTTFQELAVTREEIANFEPAPAAYNYVSHMYNAVHNGDVAESIELQKAMMNRFSSEQPAKERVLTEHFKKSCYYEWMFWEMPWTTQNWMQGVYMNEPTANL